MTRCDNVLFGWLSCLELAELHYENCVRFYDTRPFPSFLLYARVASSAFSVRRISHNVSSLNVGFLVNIQWLL